MQVAKLTQDYYGFISQSTLPGKQLGPDQAQTPPPRPAVLPAERLVEGELLKNRNKGSGGALGDMLQRGRFAYAANSSQDQGIGPQATQRAVNAYLDNAASSNTGTGSRSPSIDYYA